MQPVGTHGGEVMYFGCVCFRGELGFLNCDDICMCVVNKQFELLEFLIPFILNSEIRSHIMIGTPPRVNYQCTFHLLENTGFWPAQNDTVLLRLYPHSMGHPPLDPNRYSAPRLA